MGRGRQRRRNVYTHLTAAVVVPGCLALCWWQVSRALSGNSLSWAYVFEWPIFAGYAVFMWWKLIHDPGPDGDRAKENPGPDTTTAAVDPDGATDPGVATGTETHTEAGTEEDEELASYNRYLAALNASGRRKTW